jgi:sugar phosphate isomerase/epimerase
MPLHDRFSVQLYSLRRMSGLADQLRLVRDCGLTQVELHAANFDDAAETARLLDRHGLTAPSGHVGIGQLRSDFDGMVRRCSSLRTELLVLWGMPEGERPQDAAGWQGLGAELGRIAGRLARHDIRFAFHNHDWELARFEDGRFALEHLFAGAEGALGWQPDLAWVARGGEAIELLLDALGHLIVAAHVKDLAPPGGNLAEDGWADLGTGQLDWRSWWPRLVGLGARLMVLEHDEPADPERFLRTSVAYARKLMTPGDG